MAKKVESTKAPRKPRTSKPKELSKNTEELTPKEVTSEVEETLEEVAPEEAIPEIAPEVEETPEEVAPEIAPEETVSEDAPETSSEDPAETETPASSEESPEEIVSNLPEDGTELPEDVAPFDPSEIPESQDESEDFHAYVRKLNPNLEDGKSKWVACVANGSAEHKIYKGSYLKAYTAADNYNVKHGLQKGFVPKLRK